MMFFYYYPDRVNPKKVVSVILLLLALLSNSCNALASSSTFQPGDIVATYRVPANFNSLNGLAWDGEQLWGVDYIEARSDAFWKYVPDFIANILTSWIETSTPARAYRMDITGTVPGSAPRITHTLILDFLKMEGAPHDTSSHLFIGSRPTGSRKSARIITLEDKHGTKLSEFDIFIWPDKKSHGGYRDPCGIAHDGTRIYWSANGDHSDLQYTAVQVINTDGSRIKQLWFPDKSANDITYYNGSISYKPSDRNVIRIIDIAVSKNNSQALLRKTYSITSGTVTEHWGATYDEMGYLFLSQESPGGKIWKIYLPIESIM